jgi:O-antigen/teichoic acid export membrane protein
MMSDLSNKTAQGAFWSLAEYFGIQAVQLVISIILARLLLPEQFGLIGMLAIFMAIAQSLLDSGFGSALIQKKDADQVDASSVFYFNLAIGTVLVLIFLAVAPTIASYFEEPLLEPLTRVLSLNILINAFILVPQVLLTKQMDFKTIMKATLAANLFSGVVSILMALGGFGVWALAAQSILANLLKAIMLWFISRWQPLASFSLASLKSMFAFGSRMLLSGLLDSAFANIYQPLIGRLFTTADVGYYDRARNLERVAIQPAGYVLGRVMFPALSSIQEDRPRMRNAVREALLTTAFFHFAIMIGLIAVAEPFVIITLSARWIPSIPYFQLFCAAGLLFPMHVINLNILTAVGKSNYFFRLEVVKKIITLLIIGITYRFGILGLLYGQVINSFLAYFINSFYSKRLLNYSIWQQLRDLAPYFFMSAMMGAGAYLAGLLIESLWPRLILQALVGVVTYLLLNIFFNRSRLNQVWELAHQILPSQGTIIEKKTL